MEMPVTIDNKNDDVRLLDASGRPMVMGNAHRGALLPDFMPLSWKAGFGSTGTTMELGDKLEELGERLGETVENARIVADGDAYTTFIDDQPRKGFLDKTSCLYNISNSLILRSVSLIIAHHPMFHFLNASSQHS